MKQRDIRNENRQLRTARMACALREARSAEDDALAARDAAESERDRHEAARQAREFGSINAGELR